MDGRRTNFNQKGSLGGSGELKSDDVPFFNFKVTIKTVYDCTAVFMIL